MGVAVVLASTCDLQVNGASTVTLHAVEIRPDGSAKSGSSEAVGPGTPIDVPFEQALFPPFNPPGVLQRFADPSMIRMAMKTELFNSIRTGPPADLIYAVRTNTVQNSNLARSVKSSSPLFHVCYTIPRSLKAAVYLPQFLETPAHFVIKRRNDTSVVETPAVKKAREENVPPSEAQKALVAPGYPVPAASVMPVLAEGAAASLDKKVGNTADSEVDGKPLEPGEVAEDANNDRPWWKMLRPRFVVWLPTLSHYLSVGCVYYIMCSCSHRGPGGVGGQWRHPPGTRVNVPASSGPGRQTPSVGAVAGHCCGSPWAPSCAAGMSQYIYI